VATVFVNYSARLGYAVVLPEMIRDLGLNRTAGGTIYNAYLLTYIAFTPLTGYLTDRAGARLVITAGALVLGLGVVLMGRADALPAAALAYAIAGLGSAGIWTPSLAVVQRWFAPRRRGLALGLLSTAYGAGFAVTGALVPWIVSRWSWHQFWFLLGAAAWVLVVIDAAVLRRDPQSAGWLPWDQAEPLQKPVPAVPSAPRGALAAHAIRSRTFALIGASYLAITYGLYGFTTFMVDYASDQLGLPLERASLLATVHGVAQIVGVLTILPLSDRLGRRRTLLLSNSLIAACLAGIVLAGGEWRLLFVLVGTLALFYGPTFAMYGACAGDYFPREVIGTVMGAWTPFFGVGAIAVHWVTGLLRDASGSYTAAFAIDAGMAALSVVLLLAVRGGASRLQPDLVTKSDPVGT
jgi:sugar phosphate permease